MLEVKIFFFPEWTGIETYTKSNGGGSLAWTVHIINVYYA